MLFIFVFVSFNYFVEVGFYILCIILLVYVVCVWNFFGMVIMVVMIFDIEICDFILIKVSLDFFLVFVVVVVIVLFVVGFNNICILLDKK